ncbi:DUF4365 domain-containing protein [Spirosoma sp. HMF3257]|uniref:DUF4365 domain-containing protein n=1 Tax=Spirosoma telluris TaxID=2183553 RepID=A0A327NSQ7_9BACT|nr:DUF4365 domain-containing protein [Spirosoma telluris]RAI78282.1 hypothetical protein HMF3257_37060 [Spirosoma telluris]
MSRFSNTERVGVNRVESIFLSDFEWIPRTILQTDVGIDMFVEISNNGLPTGKFFGVQIKSGISYFSEQKPDSVVFRTDGIHINYWLNNSLPIIIVLHNPVDNNTIWQVVKEETIEKLGKNYKIEVPKNNILNKTFKYQLSNLNTLPPGLLKLQRLLFEKSLIEKIRSGDEIVLELAKYINKSSQRANIRIIEIIRAKVSEDDELYEDEDVPIIREEELYKFSMTGISGRNSLYHIYPWAEFDLDIEFYENYDDYDEENPPGYITIIAKGWNWDNFKELAYYNNGEAAFFRYVMSLNEYGKTFIDFFDFYDGKKQLEINFNAH